MKGVVFLGERNLDLLDFPDPTPGEGEVVLEIKASGLCGSDLKYYRAPKHVGEAAALGLRKREGPIIVGHEPAGIVVAVGPGVNDREARVGQRVMCHHYKGCGACEHCRSGWTQLCGDDIVIYGSTGHGAHAPYMKVPASTLVPLPDSLSFATGAAISCGTGTAYAALERMKASGRDTIAIFGQGPVGLSATQLAASMGARVIALDIDPDRLSRAREFGAFALVNPTADDPVAAIADLTGGLGAELTLETSGSPTARAAAARSTRVWGTCCLVGQGGQIALDVTPDIVRKQLTLIGSWTFSKIGQVECARFIERHDIDVDSLFTDRWRLEQAAEAYALFDKQSSGKGVFLM